MLRLAHRILSQPVFHDASPPGLAEAREDEAFRAALIGLPIIVADNVADFCPRSEYAKLGAADYPCVAPPFEAFFVEWNVSPIWHDDWLRQCGFSVVAEDLVHHRWEQTAEVAGIDEYFGEALSKARWRLWTEWWYSASQPLSVIRPEAELIVLVGDDGRIVLPAGPEGPLGYLRATVGQRTPALLHELACATSIYFNVAALTLSFMNCKNVVIEDAAEREGPARKWLRRIKCPQLHYRVLNIDPMRKVLRSEGRSEETGLKKALHICRGHFASYTEERPLFGKYTGTFWRPAHVRGSAEFGEVRKTYNVRAVNEQRSDATTSSPNERS